YEMVPGFFSHLIVTIVVSLMTKTPSAEVQEEFDRAAMLASIAAQDEDVDYEEAAEKLKYLQHSCVTEASHAHHQCAGRLLSCLGNSASSTRSKTIWKKPGHITSPYLLRLKAVLGASPHRRLLIPLRMLRS